MISAVVFDFDGVLANSEPLHFRAFRDVLLPLGFVLTEQAYFDRYLGYDDVGAFRTIAADRGVVLSEPAVEQLVTDKAAMLEELERGSSVLFPGAREAVIRMANHGAVAIASGALRAEIERVLVREGLREYFRVLVAAGETATSKPDPAPYRRAVELLAEATGRSVQPAECVAVEDSRWGLQSARAAGLLTVGITQSYTSHELADADAIIQHLDELTPQLLDTLSR